MNIRVFEQSLPSDRTADVSTSSCTVTNRSTSWTKTCACPFTCTSPVAVNTLTGFLGLLIVSFSSELQSLLLTMCIFSRKIPRCFAGTICFSWGFLRWLFLKSGRARISLMRFTFLDNASRLSFSLPNSISYQVHPENFVVGPAEAFNPNSSTFRGIEFIGSQSWDTQPWIFLPQNGNCSLSTFFSRPRAGFLLTVGMSKQATNATNASVSRLATTTHGMMPIITRRSFTSCSP